ncbi:MAG: ABC transporter ATP-binding protein [Defluviitaleaceae bacterium]|nr:ABC transporter ATP-binding protein [Defluviitaleaceae bacterium]
MAGVELRNVTKKYRDGVVALRNFCLDVRDGEFVVLTGPPGCGKSAVLRAVAGIDVPTEGEIRIGDRLVSGVRAEDRGSALVSRDYLPNMNKSVYKNMEGGTRGNPFFKTLEDGAGQKVRETARMLGIEHLLERAAKDISSSQRRKAAMGRAIVSSPQIYMIDDLLAGLEMRPREQMRLEILSLHRRLRATFIYAARDHVEAVTLGSRVVVMRDGAAEQADTPANIYRRPVNLFVAGYFGSPQMNFVEAELVSDDGRVFAAWKGCKIRLSGTHAEAVSAGGYVGRAVILGIRPEDLLCGEEASVISPGGVVEARVEHTAMLGQEVILYLSAGGQAMTSRVSPLTEVAAGDAIRLSIATDRLHIFDKDTERAIT